jgi:hypothetical protein
LGDVPKLNEGQIWERWSDQGCRSVVWGVMNGSRRDAPLCEVFVPDPWTFSEKAFPKDLNNLILLPRYLAKNYLDISAKRVFFQGLKLLGTIFKKTPLPDFLDALIFLVRVLRKLGFRDVSFILFYEYLSTLIFLNITRKKQPDRAIIFLNSMAHVQHHYWNRADGKGCCEIEFTIDTLDKIFGRIFDAQTDTNCFTNLAVINALSQRCAVGLSPWILYRPKNHEKLMKQLGLKATRVEPLMTYDAHVFFGDKRDRDEAYEILQLTTVNGNPLFFVEKDISNSQKLFYRVSFSSPLAEGSSIDSTNYVAPFFDCFNAVVKRTGEHVSNGDVLTNLKQEAIEVSNDRVAELLGL